MATSTTTLTYTVNTQKEVTAEDLLSQSQCPSPGEIVEHLSVLAQDENKLAKYGTFSAAIYDTAWVSMVSRDNNGRNDWVFPQAFEFLLASQNEDGTWPRYTSQVDDILNSMAGLLALVTRRMSLQLDSPDISALESRITRAHAGVQSFLAGWKVDGTDHVAFEVIVPALLRYLEDLGHTFHFEGRQLLMSIHTKKLQKFVPRIVYSEHKTTVLHSLEAFQGLVDFDQISHHCSIEYGICGSPASTAAYLMNVSEWDARAETYISNVLYCHGCSGGVPNAFPTCMFELSWAVSALYSTQLELRDLQAEHVTKIAAFFINTLQKQSGITGFAPGVVEDGDDTARVLISLRRLGYQIDVDPMIQCFQTSKHFRTYMTERNPSFSANCNVLLALLESGSVSRHQSYINNTTEYLLEQWSAATVKDKWNLSEAYSHMLLSEALVCLLRKHDSGEVLVDPDVAFYKIPTTLCQIVTRSTKCQRMNGSWDDLVEVTAYNVLLLAQCLSLPWTCEVRRSLEEHVQKGQAFISAQYGNSTRDHRLWIEKTTYQPRFLRVVYCSIALGLSVEQPSWSKELTACFHVPAKQLRMLDQLLPALPLLHQSTIPSIGLVLTEAQLFAKRLRLMRSDIIPRDQIPMTKDNYFTFIPVIWVVCNNIGKESLSTDVLWEMLVISLLNYQMDEYMESVIISLDEHSLGHLTSTIKDRCGYRSDRSDGLECNDKAKSLPIEGSKSEAQYSSFPTNEVTVVTKYIDHILQHPAVVQSPQLVQKQLATQLHNFLIAHMNHNASNIQRQRGAAQASAASSSFLDPQQDYVEWVKSTAADDTSCPFSFQFFSCLISRPKESVFPSAEAGYVSKSLARHLATMCRQYNDYGSAQRDAEEGNLNSLDFPDFVMPEATTEEAKSAKAELMDIAGFERRCMNLCLETLKERSLAGEAALRAIEVFINVTDMFGQVYVQKDIASRVVSRNGNQERKGGEV